MLSTHRGPHFGAIIGAVIVLSTRGISEPMGTLGDAAPHREGRREKGESQSLASSPLKDEHERDGGTMLIDGRKDWMIGGCLIGASLCSKRG
jgi:hypothetical protein